MGSLDVVLHLRSRYREDTMRDILTPQRVSRNEHEDLQDVTVVVKDDGDVGHQILKSSTIPCSCEMVVVMPSR